jgi:hypothetical protein
MFKYKNLTTNFFIKIKDLNYFNKYINNNKNDKLLFV